MRVLERLGGWLLMAVEVLRKLVGGVWKTVVEEGGAALVDLPVYKITVSVTDDQIKALPTTAVELIPSPGPGKIVTPLAGFVILDARAGLYVSSGPSGPNAAWQLWYGPAGPVGGLISEGSGLVTPAGTGEIGSLTDVLNFAFPVPLVGVGDFNFSGYLLNTQKVVPEDLAVCIADNFWGLSDYTGGDSANTMNVTVIYAIIDLPT